MMFVFVFLTKLNPGVFRKTRHPLKDSASNTRKEDYLEKLGMALQLGWAQRSHRTQTGPEMDVGQQRTGS